MSSKIPLYMLNTGPIKILFTPIPEYLIHQKQANAYPFINILVWGVHF